MQMPRKMVGTGYQKDQLQNGMISRYLQLKHHETPLVIRKLGYSSSKHRQSLMNTDSIMLDHARISITRQSVQGPCAYRLFYIIFPSFGANRFESR
jgi:hypothetical protein